MDAFEVLGLERGLAVDEESLAKAFREAGRARHPDHGGSVESFEEAEQAHRLLKDPASRLKHWLELKGVDGDLRGSIGSDLMSLFMELGERLQRADALIREREHSSSALAKAMLEGRTQEIRDELEEALAKLEALLAERIQQFSGVESGQVDGWELARELAFLSKWQGQARERFGCLW